MRRSLIRYRVVSGQVPENAALVERVFEELRSRAPTDLRYLVLKLDDGGFVHFVETDGDQSVLPRLESFRAFQSGLRERQIEPTTASGATIVGDYRMLAR